MLKEKKVELIELFYDLIYVYAISNLTKLLQTETTDIFGDFGRYFILCLVILQAWLYLTNYVNRYGEWNKSEYLLTTVNMLATIYMANTISDDWEIVSKSFNLAMLVMLGCVLAMYLLQFFKKKNDLSAARNSVVILSLVCVLYFVGFLLSYFHIHQYVLVVDIAAVLTGAFLPLVLKGKFSSGIIHFPHLVERLELITIITFGECVVGITDYFDVNFVSVKAILVFVNVLLLFGCYVLQIHRLCDHEQDARALRMMFSHYLIVISLNLLTITLGYANDSDAGRNFNIAMMIISLTMFFISIYADSSYYYKGISFSLKDALISLASAAMGIVLMLVISDKTTAALCGCAVIAAVNFCILLYKYENRLKNKTL